ncbi:MAG TPA: hypothetical protein VEA59_01895 [Patescibacteria group bacterium]|nr:hypothetical protein [Patescibacteria group bacterium]
MKKLTIAALLLLLPLVLFAQTSSFRSTQRFDGNFAVGQNISELQFALNPAPKGGIPDDLRLMVPSDDRGLTAELVAPGNRQIFPSRDVTGAFFARQKPDSGQTLIHFAPTNGAIWVGAIPAGSPSGIYKLRLTRSHSAGELRYVLIVTQGTLKRIDLQPKELPVAGKSFIPVTLLADFETGRVISNAHVLVSATARIPRRLAMTTQTNEPVSLQSSGRVIDGWQELITHQLAIESTDSATRGNYPVTVDIPESAVQVRVTSKATWQDSGGSYMRVASQLWDVKPPMAEFSELAISFNSLIEAKNDPVTVTVQVSGQHASCYAIGLTVHGEGMAMYSDSTTPTCVKEAQKPLRFSIRIPASKLNFLPEKGTLYAYRVSAAGVETVAETRLTSAQLAGEYAIKLSQ